MIGWLCTLLFILMFLRQCGITHGRDLILAELAAEYNKLYAGYMEEREYGDELFDKLVVAQHQAMGHTQAMVVMPPSIIGEGDVDIRA